MEKIRLHDVLPQVFADSPPMSSEIWQRNIAFQKGEYYIVEAASGAGKSSFCSYIYGARQDYKGVISLDDVDIRMLSLKQWVEIRRTQLAYLPQDMGLFPELTAFENIQLKNRLTKFKSKAEILSMLAKIGMEEKANTPAALLSIGQQQRVAIVRALCQPFDFIILDEPVSHLDKANNLIAANMIMAEAKAQGAGIIATSVGNRIELANAAHLIL